MYDAEFLVILSMNNYIRPTVMYVMSGFSIVNSIISVHYFFLSDSFRGMLVPLAFSRDIKH